MWTKLFGVRPAEVTKRTLELRELVESGCNIWDFDYPSYYSGEAKKAFEQKVIDHFYFRQIGQETPGRWLHYFRTRMREIMPYYLQMYRSVELMEAQEDPFEAYHLVETYTEKQSNTAKAETTSDGTNTSDSTNKFSDTPQGTIENLETHLTNATLNNETNTATGSSTANTENEGEVTHTLIRKGNIGVQPLGKEVKALRESFVNVDQMIINELNDLFLMVY